MQTPKIGRDILPRSVAAALVLGCGAYFTFGVAAAAAACQRGTAIRHYEPVSFGMLLQEVSKVSFSAVIAWVSLIDGIDGFWFLGAPVLWFLGALPVTFALAANPRSRRAVDLAGWVLGLGVLFGWRGLWSLYFTFLNAFAWRGLDGEWIIELGPVFDAVGVLYLITLLLFLRSLALRVNGRAPDPAVVLG